MKVRELLNDESKWTQGSYARTASKIRTAYNSEEATCWCLEGAIYKCYSRGPEVIAARKKIHKAISTLIGVFDPKSTILFNDAPHRTFSDIQRVLELANV